jgi:hypothetical protein
MLRMTVARGTMLNLSLIVRRYPNHFRLHLLLRRADLAVGFIREPKTGR